MSREFAQVKAEWESHDDWHLADRDAERRHFFDAGRRSSDGEGQEINRGGIPVKNASYWRRQFLSVQRENYQLRDQLNRSGHVPAEDPNDDPVGSERHLFHLWPCGIVCHSDRLEEYLTFMSDDYLTVSMPDEDIDAVPSYKVVAELRAAHPPCLIYPKWMAS